MSTPTLIIYGATSFTARQLLLYLDTHPDSSQFEFILAGRNAQKLESLNEDLLQTRREVIACDLDDGIGVKRLVEQGQVVVNLAGPFRDNNAEALIRECASTGKHYVDLTGEAAWVAKDIIPKYHYHASKTGACIVPSCGFDSIPSDLTLYHGLRTLQSSHPDASITKSTSFFRIVGGSVSGGSFQTIRSVADLPPSESRVGEWAMVPSTRGPSPPPKFIFKLDEPSVGRPLIGSFFFMYPYNRCIVRRSWWLSRLDLSTITGNGTRRTKNEEPVHGGGLVYAESMETGSRFKSWLVNGCIILFGILFLGSRITRSFISLFLPIPKSGPSDSILHNSHYAVTNVSETTEPGVKIVTTCKASGDPGYLSTCYMLAESALSLILPSPKGTFLPPLAQQGGVLTPSTAMGMVLVKRLERSGKVMWESRLVQ